MEHKKIIEPKMVLVEGGTFIMGKDHEYDDEYTPYKVTLDNFYIGKYTVTKKEWIEIMGYDPCAFIGDSSPVENVSWYDAQTFIAKLSQLTERYYRLPTEAEWEYAARGGNRSKGYEYAGSNNVDEVAWYYRKNSWIATQPVGTKKPNELGIYDMSGNVLEWCQDWWAEDYEKSQNNNPKGPDYGESRVMRGGSWYNDEYSCRCTDRGNRFPFNRSNNIGFRLAQDKNANNLLYF